MFAITNPILRTDSYKFSHAGVYPESVVATKHYIEARVNGQVIVPAGYNFLLDALTSLRITQEDVNEAEAFCKAHGEPFNRAGFMKIVRGYNGYWPVVIKASPEGLPIMSNNAIMTIESVDPELYWVPSFLETMIQRAVWYPTTIASRGFEAKKTLAHFYELSGADTGLLPFALHDFGGRGVSSSESAMLGGVAHLFNFMGSDTVEAVHAANVLYNSPMSAFSVPASEHSIEIAYGDKGEDAYLSAMLEKFAKPGAIVSIVLDGYDVYRAAERLCSTFKERIVASGAKVVFRPDSGDMFEVVPKLLKMQAEAFGTTLTSKGFKQINHVGILQGDGISNETMGQLLAVILAEGFAANTIVFGSGGALLQKVNRDTYRFAQKQCAIKLSSMYSPWVGTSKRPVTDPGKNSKEGNLSLFRNVVDGSFVTLDQGQVTNPNLTEVLREIYAMRPGFATPIVHREDLATIRARLAV